MTTWIDTDRPRIRTQFRPRAAGGSMILRQLFDPASSSFSYLIARRRGGAAVLIDPVLEHVDAYLELLAELDLRLLAAIDTHLHADRCSGLRALAARSRCLAAMSERTQVRGVDLRLADGEVIAFDGLELRAMHTPGHTLDSMCFTVDGVVFTGDTLLIGGTGRTDLPGGDAAAAYESLFGRLLRLPDATRVYPAHDYRGRAASTIGAERAGNPRLQVRSRAEYVALMARLDLPAPRLMQVALAANLGSDVGAAESAGMPRDEVPAGPAELGDRIGWLRRLTTRWRRRHEQRRTLAVLAGVDPRTLRDLGIDRSEIGSIAAELHGAAERTRQRVLQELPWG